MNAKGISRVTDRSTDPEYRAATPTRSTDPTDGRTRRTNEESWLSRREILTFRNARAHIRIFLAANFHTDHIDAIRKQLDAEEAQT